ncbi:MAG: hypothetical protein ACJAW8_002048 [Oleispira sp.]|jgi:hypothetical protein
MDIKRLVSASFILLSSGCIASDKIEKTEFQLFQDYAFSACIANGYKDGDIYSDSISALNGYRARSRMPLEAHFGVNKVVEKWLAKPYKTSGGETTEIAACLDLIKSDDLTALYNQYTPCKDVSAWIDKSEFAVRCKNG